MQVVREVLEDDLQGSAVAGQQFNGKHFYTERAFVPYDQIHKFNNPILTIIHTHFTEFLEGFRLAGNEEGVLAMNVTINQDDFPAKAP